MQNWNDEIQKQLNNLPGFPAIPNTAPPVGDRWILGDWIGECHVRPEVANAAALPLTGNETGDVRVSLADQLWYIWDGAAWQAMGGGGGGIGGAGANGQITLWNGAATVTGSSQLAWQIVTTGASLNNRARIIAVGGNTNTLRLQAGDGGTEGVPFCSTTDYLRTSTSNSSGSLFYSGPALPNSPSGQGGDWFVGQADDGTSVGKLVVWAYDAGGGRPGSSQERLAFQRNFGAGGPEAVFNAPGQDVDFRVQTVPSGHSLFVRGSDGNVGILAANPTSSFSVGAASEFQVNSGGDIVAIRGQTTTFPAANAAGVLTNNGAGTLSWSPVSTTTTIDIPSTAQEPLAAGDLVCFNDNTGTPNVRKADATNAEGRLNPVGFAVAAAVNPGDPVTVRIVGVADVPAGRFDVAPAVTDVGKRVFVSTTSGQITLTAPSASGDVVQRAGVLVDGSANPKVLVQIGDPVLL